MTQTNLQVTFNFVQMSKTSLFTVILYVQWYLPFLNYGITKYDYQTSK